MKKEVYGRLFKYWVNVDWESWIIHRPESCFDTGNTYVMTLSKNHAPYANEIGEWLSSELGMDYGDFYIESYGENYAFNPSDIPEDEKKLCEYSYGRSGALEPSFRVEDWEKIVPKKGVEFIPYKEVFRRPEPSSESEAILGRVETMLKELHSEISSMNSFMYDIRDMMGNICTVLERMER